MAAVAAQNQEARPVAVKAELVVQNGRLKGTHRELDKPATFIGKSSTCDIRLNVDGISPIHCLIIKTGTEVLLRDLESVTGTQVNGKCVPACTLRHGDLIMVGPYQFQVQIHRETSAELDKGADIRASSRPAREEAVKDRTAYRIQAAAVAAQQAALTEWEFRLVQREVTLEKQQTQLATHLEENRQRLVELNTQTQAARQALLVEKQEYQRHVEDVTVNLGKAERDILTQKQENEAQKKRLALLHKRLVQRARRHVQIHRRKLETQAADLDEAAARLEQSQTQLQQQKNELAQMCVTYNSEVELGRRQLQAEWDRFQREQQQVGEQLQFRFGDILTREGRLMTAEKLLEKEQQRHRRVVEDWNFQSQGLENRIRNHRHHLANLQAEIRTARKSVDKLLQSRQRTAVAHQAGVLPLHLGRQGAATAGLVSFPIALPWPVEWRIQNWLRPFAPITAAAVNESEQAFRNHLADVSKLTGELADQRLVLAEQWQHLAQIQCQWEQTRQALCGQMVAVLAGLQQQAQSLLAREHGVAQAVEDARSRHQELLRFREHLVGWQGRLRAEKLEAAAQQEQQQIELDARESALQQQVAALSDLSERWVELRRQEAESWRAKQEACDKAAQEYLALNQERRQFLRKLEEDRRVLTTKALALEKFRQECLVHTGDAAGSERRMEQLQRRWSTEELKALRLSKRECDSLQAEMNQSRGRVAELEQQLAGLLAENQTLLREQNDWQQDKLRLDSVQLQLREQLRGTVAQRDQLEQHFNVMHAEVERIARELLEESPGPAVLERSSPETETPIFLPLDKAA